jgi:hypothetical protein
MTEIRKKLAEAEEDYRNARSAVDAKRQRRNELVKEAIAAGMSHSQIAKATGLTRGRIAQISQI